MGEVLTMDSGALRAAVAPTRPTAAAAAAAAAKKRRPEERQSALAAIAAGLHTGPAAVASAPSAPATAAVPPPSVAPAGEPAAPTLPPLFAAMFAWSERARPRVGARATTSTAAVPSSARPPAQLAPQARARLVRALPLDGGAVARRRGHPATAATTLAVREYLNGGGGMRPDTGRPLGRAAALRLHAAAPASTPAPAPAATATSSHRTMRCAPAALAAGWLAMPRQACEELHGAWLSYAAAATTAAAAAASSGGGGGGGISGRARGELRNAALKGKRLKLPPPAPAALTPAFAPATMPPDALFTQAATLPFAWLGALVTGTHVGFWGCRHTCWLLWQ
mgnify:CR=1 FL=1